MKFSTKIVITLSLILCTPGAFAELPSGARGKAYRRQSGGKQLRVSEKEYRCLNARKGLEQMFAQGAKRPDQPFDEVRDAIQAYKSLDCVFTAGFLFSTPRQVDKYFRYKAQAAGRAPASLR